MHHARFLFFFFLFWTGIYSGFRGLTYWYNIDKTTEATRMGLLDALWLGVHFDWQVVSCCLALPFLWLSMVYFRGKMAPWEGRFLRGYLWLASFVALAICAADLPYFAFFNSRISTAALLWKDTPGQVTMFLLESPEYYPFLLVTVLGGWWLTRLTRFTWKKIPPIKPISESNNRQSVFIKILTTLVLLGFLIFGIWGGVWQPAPLRIRDSFHSNNGFLNQLSINPARFWFDSFWTFNIHFISDKEAIAKTRTNLGIAADSTGYDSPIARYQKAEGAVNGQRLNVVILLVESLSAERLAVFGNANRPMPFLDSLAGESLFFKNFYSAGIHTSNGLAGTLFSHPALFSEHPMANKKATEQRFEGISTTLKSAGYRTAFFATSHKTFDNMGFFLSGNGFDLISDKQDYPSDLWVNSWGVSDKSLLDHGLKVIDSLAQNPELPFLATLLTISTHPPYELPPDAVDCPIRPKPAFDQVWQYSDWCLRNFFRSCAQRPWFQNTIFIILGDHGYLPREGSPFDVALPYNHIPCMFYAPAHITPEVRADMASQIDVYPTLMHLLGIGFTNYTLGIDLFRQKRPFAVFSQDSKIGVINERYLYVLRKSGSSSLYDYTAPSSADLQGQLPQQAESMRMYGVSLLQTGQWLLDKGLVGGGKH